MSGIFISYRRQDSAGWVGRLTDSLKENFGEDQIFMDIEAIEAGVDFVESINKAVGSCQVLLAIIGPRWLSVTDQGGRRRLDNPEDFIHLEIAAALQRNVRVIPVLVGGAEIPASDQLPDDLKPLARRQAHEISDTRWEYDSEQLVKLLEKALGRKSKKKSAAESTAFQSAVLPLSQKGVSVKASIGLVLSLFVFLFLLSGDSMDTNTAVGAIMFLLTALVLGIIAFYDVKLNKVRGKVLAIGSIALAVILCFVVFGRFSSHTPAQQGDLPSDTSAAIAQVAPSTVDPSDQQPAAQPEYRSTVPARVVNITGSWHDTEGGILYFQQEGNTFILSGTDDNGIEMHGNGFIDQQIVTFDIGANGYTLGRAQMILSDNRREMRGTLYVPLTGASESLVLRKQ